MMTNLAPTSLSDMRPSGETLERVRPGISRVVARSLGVADPDTLALRANLERTMLGRRWGREGDEEATRQLTVEDLMGHWGQEYLSRLGPWHVQSKAQAW